MLRALFAPAALLALLAAAALPAETGVVTKPIEYKDGEVALIGYLAYDAAKAGPRPGVLVVHDWIGLGDFAKKKAEELAALGYVALAVDMYGGGLIAADQEEAGKLAGALKGDRATMRSRVRAGLETLAKQPQVAPGKLAAIGFCFGGTTVLELARSGAPVAGVVSFHGGLDTPNPGDARNIKGKVLVLHGADDPLVPPAEVSAFEDEMRRAKVDWQLVAYGGAVHSFTNPKAGIDPSRGVAYNERAAQRSWRAMKDFFAEIF
ncbi:MAG: dienelactone hydrolase family protein [Acidobacteria bacterium]|jgi:dienelactone hydrolase|nr:dienelactone hydrolase family protein [Acidobacteriota bacterium]